MPNKKNKFRNKIDFGREEFSTELYKRTGVPRPREARFIPAGVRKDLKIKMRHKIN